MKRKLQNDQTGMVAIVVTMILMFVITLVVLGFAQVTQHNQREAVDTELGTQAYYAAETGVNDVVTSIKAGFTPTNSNCQPFSAKQADNTDITLPRALKTDAGTATVANTCLMVDANPTKLNVGSIKPTTDSIAWKVKNADGNPFKTLTFEWSPETTTPTACDSAITLYPSANKWNCNYGLLRVDILQANPSSTQASDLAAATATLYLQPLRSQYAAVNIAGFDDSNPSAYKGACRTDTDTCSVAVNFNYPTSWAPEYYVRLTSLYRAAENVTLTGTDLVSGDPVHFSDGQVVIDSTGRAQDQLKRIQVRIPLQLSSSALQPVFGVQGTDAICKDLKIINSNYDEQSCAGTWPR